jgi:hypothetical protein
MTGCPTGGKVAGFVTTERGDGSGGLFESRKAGCAAGTGPFRAPWRAAAGFWRVCRRVECHQELRKSLSDAAWGQHATVGALWALPRQVHVFDGSPRQAQLGVGQRDQPGPAIGLLRSPHTRCGPVERLLAEAIGVLQVKPMDVGSPDDRQVGLPRSAPPQPQAFGNPGLAR